MFRSLMLLQSINHLLFFSPLVKMRIISTIKFPIKMELNGGFEQIIKSITVLSTIS